MPDVSKFGFRENVGTGWEPVWPGAAPYPFPSSAVAVRVAAGGNAADAAAGTGARTIRVYGLDANWAPINEDITLAGASASSATSATFLRVFRAYVLTAGSGEWNAGDIDIEQVGGDVLAVIPAGYGQTQQAVYTVPAGEKIAFDRGFVYVEGTKPASYRFVIRYGIDGATPARRAVYVAFGVEGPDAPRPKFPVTVYGPADVWMEAKAAVAADVSARFEGEATTVH